MISARMPKGGRAAFLCFQGDFAETVDLRHYVVYTFKQIEYVGYSVPRGFNAGKGNAAWVKGNQVRVLSDPVTVSGERGCGYPLCGGMRRSGRAMSREPGNLLKRSGAQLPKKADCPDRPEGFIDARYFPSAFVKRADVFFCIFHHTRRG
jgi:hypothetical protein